MPTKTIEDSWWDGDQTIEFRHRAALDLIDEGPVLDLGCGDGLFLEMLEKRGIKGIGLDVSPAAVKKCAAKGIDARVHSFDAPLPYPDNSFAYVTILDVLEHLYNAPEVLREAARVSSRYVIIGVPNFSSLPARVQVLLGKVPENNRPHQAHLRWFNAPVLAQVAAQASLKSVALHMNTFAPVSLLGQLGPRLLPNLLALSYLGKYEKQA